MKTALAILMLAGAAAADPQAVPPAADLVGVPGVSADVLSQAAEEEDLTVVAEGRHSTEEPVLKVTSQGCSISLITEVTEKSLKARSIDFAGGFPRIRSGGGSLRLEYEDKGRNVRLYSPRFRKKIEAYLTDFAKTCDKPRAVF